MQVNRQVLIEAWETYLDQLDKQMATLKPELEHANAVYSKLSEYRGDYIEILGDKAPKELVGEDKSQAQALQHRRPMAIGEEV